MRQMSLVVFLVAWVFCGTAESANFRCAGGDVSCLIDAIDASNGNSEANTIHLAPGIYSLTEVNNVSVEPPSNSPSSNGLPVIIGTVTIVGTIAEATIIERADFTSPSQTRFRIFRVASSGTLVLDGVTVRGGYPGFPFRGGALFSEGTVTITRSIVTQNLAGACGAIDLEGNASFTVRESRIVGNSVELGGNILCVGFLTPAAVSVLIDRTSVSDNRPQEGFAIAIQIVGTAIISNSTISNNRTSFIGGAITTSGDVTIVNSTIANNFAGLSGSAVSGQGPGVHIENSTITNNQGRHSGVRGAVALHNTIVAGHVFDGVPSDCAFFGGQVQISSLGHNLIGNPVNCGTLLSSDLTGDPGLTGFVDTGRPGGGVVRLRSDSRAIDAADNFECPSTDQQGLARPIDGNGDAFRACDIGATEFYPVVTDLVELERVDTKDIRRGGPDPLSGIEIQITATLRNIDARDICSVAFEVVTLQVESGAPPLLLTRRGDLIGGEGSIVPATLLGAKPDLDAQKHERYRFRIALSEMEPITADVNVLGEVTAGPCAKNVSVMRPLP